MSQPCPMSQIEQRLSGSLDWNRARVKFLSRFLVALLAVKTVCLTQVACAFPGAAQTPSHYKRLQRFLKDFDLDFGSVARLIASLVGVQGPWVLALDRTNWKLGKAELNLLVLALVHEGIAFPLFWMALGRAGNSDTEQRIAVMERFVQVFGREKVAFVCADREFPSQAFVRWLHQRGIGFCLRVKADTRIANGRGQLCCADWLFRDCPIGQERRLKGARLCLGRRLFVSGTRLTDGEFVIVVSDQTASGLADYALRWGIETLFGALKSRGFNLEATHVTEPERLCRLLALLAIAFCWAFAAGVWLAQKKPLSVKKHGRAAVSRFRRGLDWLRRLLLPLSGGFRQAQWENALQFLSCT